MKSFRYRKTNHLAIAGFLLPFVAMGVAGLMVLLGQQNFKALKFSLIFLILVPLILLVGLVSSLKSIPLVEERDDKDYAYSGLIVNILFMSLYILSLIYFFLTSSN